MAGVNNRVKITNDIELKDRLVAINRVTKVTKGGRTFSFSAIVVVGNEEGIIGWGLGKAGEVTAAIAKGVESAKKNLVKVPILKGTVPHEQSARFGGAEVFIKPASHGTGVVAGGAMRAVLESVGVTDVLAKSKGSSNPHNLVKATIEALSEMRDARMVAQNRGIRSDGLSSRTCRIRFRRRSLHPATAIRTRSQATTRMPVRPWDASDINRGRYRRKPVRPLSIRKGGEAFRTMWSSVGSKKAARSAAYGA